MSEIILPDEAATLALGRELGAILNVGDKIALTGTLGAGKTTFARGVLNGAGFGEEVPSPTFAIIQQYGPPETRIPVAHTDFYRIEAVEELQELGLDEIAEESALIAEWPDRVPDGFWHGALEITLEIASDFTRRLTWRAGQAWNDRWPI